jgi:hypothetical protein
VQAHEETAGGSYNVRNCKNPRTKVGHHPRTNSPHLSSLLDHYNIHVLC